MFIHSSMTLPVLGGENRRVKDIEEGALTLSSDSPSFDNFVFSPILDIDTAQHNDWYKITLSNEAEYILDKSCSVLLDTLSFIPLEELNVTHSIFNLEGSLLHVKGKKPFGRESLSYKIETDKDYLIVEDLVLKGHE